MKLSIRKVSSHYDDQMLSEGLILCVDGEPLPYQCKTNYSTEGNQIPTFTVVFELLDNQIPIEVMNERD